jgi:hypothetical protein
MSLQFFWFDILWRLKKLAFFVFKEYVNIGVLCLGCRAGDENPRWEEELLKVK